MNLGDLGSRICVIGQSGSGKSTMAEAIGRRTLLPVVHLDQYRHLPGTRFETRSDEEFRALHDSAAATDHWVMDGNYSQLMPHRLQRATGLILLDISTPRSLIRYLRRTLRSSQRIGGLGTRETLSCGMIRFIAVGSTANRLRRLALYDEVEVPKILLAGPRAIERFWETEHLDRREPSR